MLADFLMPLFVLTLLANALLVAFAIRGMRRGQFDSDRPSPGGGWPPTPTRSVPASQIAAEQGSVAVSPPLPDGVRRAIAAGRAAAAGALPPAPSPAADLAPAAKLARADKLAPAAELARADKLAPALGRVPAAPAARRRRPATNATTDASGTPATGSRPGRRRFALPNLDDDHEKVSRSIENFLGGIDAIAGDGSTSDVAGPTSAGGATTVAFVAVAGLPDDAGRTVSRSATRTSRGTPVETDAASVALAMVERTLRDAARGTDIVTADGQGRFRIVMASTGELAARAYVRRIRATIEVGLVAADLPLRLLVATATALNEPIEDAIRRAEQRLSVALAAVAFPSPDTTFVEPDDRPGGGSTEPRAAGD